LPTHLLENLPQRYIFIRKLTKTVNGEPATGDKSTSMQQEIEDSYNQVKVDRLIIRFMDIS